MQNIDFCIHIKLIQVRRMKPLRILKNNLSLTIVSANNIVEIVSAELEKLK